MSLCQIRVISEFAFQTRLLVFLFVVILLLTLRISLQRAGYSLQELFLLSRSQLTQQRSLALSTLANILSKVHEQTQTASRLSTEARVCSRSRRCISHPAGSSRGIPVCSERQCNVHSAGRRPALPAPFCVGRWRGGSDVCGCACS